MLFMANLFVPTIWNQEQNKNKILRIVIAEVLQKILRSVRNCRRVVENLALSKCRSVVENFAAVL